jgi:hypothetical protein
MANNTLEQTVSQSGRVVLAMDCVLADAQLQPWPSPRQHSSSSDGGTPVSFPSIARNEDPCD